MTVNPPPARQTCFVDSSDRRWPFELLCRLRLALRLNLGVGYGIEVIQPVIWLWQLLVDLIKLTGPQLGGVGAHGGSHVVVMFEITVKIEGITPAKLCAGLADACRSV